MCALLSFSISLYQLVSVRQRRWQQARSSCWRAAGFCLTPCFRVLILSVQVHTAPCSADTTCLLCTEWDMSDCNSREIDHSATTCCGGAAPKTPLSNKLNKLPWIFKLLPSYPKIYICAVLYMYTVYAPIWQYFLNCLYFNHCIFTPTYSINANKYTLYLLCHLRDKKKFNSLQLL